MRRKDDNKEQPKPEGYGKPILVGIALLSLFYGCVFIMFYIFYTVQSGAEPKSHLFNGITSLLTEIFRLLLNAS